MTGPGIEQAPLDVIDRLYRERLSKIRSANSGERITLESDAPSTRFGLSRNPLTESLTDEIYKGLAEILRITPQQVGGSTIYRTAAAQAEAMLSGPNGNAIWGELSEDEKRALLLRALTNSRRDPYSRTGSSVGYQFGAGQR